MHGFWEMVRDRWMGGRKKWHIEVGALPKNINIKEGNNSNDWQWKWQDRCQLNWRFCIAVIKSANMASTGDANPLLEAKDSLSSFGYWLKYSILNWDFETLFSKKPLGCFNLVWIMLLITKNVFNNASHDFSLIDTGYPSQKVSI